jgi:hypothetical protein
MAKLKRRAFLKKTTAVSAGLAAWMNYSAKSLKTSIPNENSEPSIPTYLLGKHSISRLIIGGNPFSFIAHSEPLIYSRELFKHYFTHEKVVETLQIAVEEGINTFLGRIDNNVVGFIDLYRKNTGLPMPWIAQTSAKPQNGATQVQILENINFAVKNGAIGIYLQGESADYLVKQGKINEIEEYISYIKQLERIAGIGAHDIGTIELCEKAGLKPDFYMKTFNRLEFCCPQFARTREVMKSINIPWIAFKVLAAGRMKPEEGFSAALETGADFLCVGMFDFQVRQNVTLFKSMLNT